MKKPHIRKKTIIIISLIALVVIAATVGLLFYLKALDERTVNINGTRIDRKEYDTMQAAAEKDTSFQQGAERSKQIIAISTKSDEIIKKYKLGITQEMLDQRSKTIFDKEWPDLNSWQRSAVESTTIMDYAYFLSKGGYEVYLYEFPFAASYASNLTDPAKNAQAIAAADQKAKQEAMLLRNELAKDTSSAGSKTIRLRNDPTFAEGYGFAMNPSRWFFMTDDARTYEGGDPENNVVDVDEQIVQQVKGLKVGNVSEVLTRTGSMPVDANASPVVFAAKPISYRVVYVHKKVTAQKDLYNQVKKEIQDMKIKEIK